MPKLRLMHVKPGGVNKVWDVILMDGRQNARVFCNLEGTEFIDLVILDGEIYHPKNVRGTPVITKSQRRRKLQLRRQKHKGKKHASKNTMGS